MVIHIFLWTLLTSVCVTRTNAAEEVDYCIAQTFNVTCPSGHVVLMTSARYGRMRAGHCVTSSYGSVGCVRDVLRLIDSWCSGQPQCDFRVRKLMDIGQPCPKDLTSYLEASYTCVKVHGIGSNECLDGSAVKLPVGETGGYLTNLPLAHYPYSSRTNCPWIVQAKTDQTISFSLLDFNHPSWSSSSTDKTAGCAHYVIFKEGEERQKIGLCAGAIRERPLFTSTTHTVTVYFIGSSFETTNQKFLLKYAAIGCPRLAEPRLGWLQQDGRTATLVCNQTRETWYLTCKNNLWIGSLGNCSTGGSSVYIQSMNNTGGFPYGILVAIVIGILLGVVIGSSMLAVVYSCYKRKLRRPHTLEDSDTKDCTYCEESGMTYPSLLKSGSNSNLSHAEYCPGYSLRRYASGIRQNISNKALEDLARQVTPFSDQIPPTGARFGGTSAPKEHVYESANFGLVGDSREPPPVYFELDSEGRPIQQPDRDSTLNRVGIEIIE